MYRYLYRIRNDNLHTHYICNSKNAEYFIVYIKLKHTLAVLVHGNFAAFKTHRPILSVKSCEYAFFVHQSSSL
jgi:hypothetical protein